MFTVHITEKGGATNSKRFDKPEITIGRIQGNDIVLPKSNISKRHARVINNGGSFVIIDSKSTNGTYINGKRIDAPYDLGRGDKIYVGDFTLEIEAEFDEPEFEESFDEPAPAPADSSSSEVLDDDSWGAGGDLDDDWADDWDDPKPRDNQGSSTHLSDDVEDEPFEAPASPTPTPEPVPREPERQSRPRVAPRPVSQPLDDEGSQALKEVHEKLLRSLDLRRMDVESMDDDELRRQTRTSVEEIVKSMDREGRLPAGVDPDSLTEQVLDEALGLGPLEEFLADDAVNEILVNGSRQVYVEIGGRLKLTDRTFSSDQAVLGVIERIVAPLGRRIDESSPMVDARLRDGSRVNAIIPPLALNGPTITIRKFTREPLQVDDLVAHSTMTADMADFLEIAVKARKNVLISGGTGSGKTTTLNVLSGFVPEKERIITIEDAAELKLDQAHVVRLEARPSNIEGRGQISIRDLVRNALRMRPDRIVIGECRGGEALDMLQAMNTGHEGSLTTVHANSPRDALARLETMVLMSGMELPVRAIREQIASAIDIVIQQIRFPDGSRKITHISEVTGLEGDVLTMQDIFDFDQQGFDGDGRVQGEFNPTGFVPRFYDDLGAMGIRADRSIFG